MVRSDCSGAGALSRTAVDRSSSASVAEEWSDRARARASAAVASWSLRRRTLVSARSTRFSARLSRNRAIRTSSPRLTTAAASRPACSTASSRVVCASWTRAGPSVTIFWAFLSFPLFSSSCFVTSWRVFSAAVIAGSTARTRGSSATSAAGRPERGAPVAAGLSDGAGGEGRPAGGTALPMPCASCPVLVEEPFAAAAARSARTVFSTCVSRSSAVRRSRRASAAVFSFAAITGGSVATVCWAVLSPCSRVPTSFLCCRAVLMERAALAFALSSAVIAVRTMS